MDKRCCEDVRDTVLFHQCSRTARFLHDGKHYCGTHYPPNVEKRRAKIDAKYNAESKRDSTRYEIAGLKAKMYETIREHYMHLLPNDILALCNRIDVLAGATGEDEKPRGAE